jgi:tripartite-type tricarboxylate transporter receptor subunit TctC
MKKMGLLFMVVLLVLFAVGCGTSTSSSSSKGEASSKSETPSGSGDSSSKSSTSASSGFPEKQIKMVIPYPPGGATDVIFRMVAAEAEKHLGQPIVPVNMKGASSTVGSRHVKDADADGYTILASHDVIATAFLSGVVDYSFEAFEPISLLTQTINIPTVNKSLGINNLKDFADYAKANPGKVKWSMTPGSTDHFFAVQLMHELGLTADEMRLIGYEGTGPQVTALVANETQGAMTNVPSGKAYFEEGTFVPLAVAHDERLDILPDVTTMKEQGIDMVHSTSRGLFAPKGTPEEVIIKIEEAFKKALENPEMKRKIEEEQGSVARFIPHNEYKGFLDNLQAELNELAKSMDLKK